MKNKFERLKSNILKKTAKMFNLYQHMKSNSDGKEQKEPETTGHDRFYQERPRTSYRKKKRRGACRRAQSAAELNPESIAAANKRNAFRIRSVSTDREESEGENGFCISQNRTLTRSKNVWSGCTYTFIASYVHMLKFKIGTSFFFLQHKDLIFFIFLKMSLL